MHKCQSHGQCCRLTLIHALSLTKKQPKGCFFRYTLCLVMIKMVVLMRKILSFLFISLFLSSCSLFITGDYLGKEWPGKDVEALLDHWGEPYNLIVRESGEQEVIYKIFSETCIYTFYTDSAGIITDYAYESTFLGTCKPIG